MSGENSQEKKIRTQDCVAFWSEIYSHELVRWEICAILRIKLGCHLRIKVTSASGNEEQAIAKQIALALCHHIVLYVLFIYMLLAHPPPPFQIAPISQGGKISMFSSITLTYSLKFRARSIWKFLQWRTDTTPRIKFSTVHYWNECHYGLFWIRPWEDWNPITSSALKGQIAWRTQS